MKNKWEKYVKENILGEPSTKEVDKPKALLKLVLGIAFCLAIFLFGVIYNRQNPKQNNHIPQKEQLTLEQNFQNFTDNYNYEIIITKDNEELEKYTGKVVNNINQGIKTIIKNNETINYTIKDKEITITNTNNKIDNLYSSYLSYFFEPLNVYTYIKEQVQKDDKQTNYTFQTTYDNKDIIFKIYITDNIIEEINYNYDDITYQIKLKK